MMNHSFDGDNSESAAIPFQLLTVEQLSRLAFLQNKALTRMKTRVIMVEEQLVAHDMELRELLKRVDRLERGV